MPRLTCPRRASLIGVAVILAALLVGCGSTVAPTAATPSGGTTASDGPNASATDAAGPSDGAPGPSGSGAATPGASPGGQPAATHDPASPPAAGDPLQDEACLAVLPVADVEGAVGTSIGDVMAIGTDPSVSLTCTYTASDGGTFTLNATAGDATAGFESIQSLAAGYGQAPVAIDGLGDQAFYAKAADRWPEQVGVVKGPVLLRLLNSTSATIGEAAFASLAATVADAIRAEIPPAP